VGICLRGEAITGRASFLRSASSGLPPPLLLPAANDDVRLSFRSPLGAEPLGDDVGVSAFALCN
jgi:hypothetical protein